MSPWGLVPHLPGKSLCSDIFLKPSDSPGVTQMAVANLNQFFQGFPFSCVTSRSVVEKENR